MTQEVTKLGEAPPQGAGRDAVHVAVIPMIALQDLTPGQRLRGGVADPFRQGVIAKGDRYWLCLYPGTVTSLRHVWTAPGFAEEAGAEGAYRILPESVLPESGPSDPAPPVPDELALLAALAQDHEDAVTRGAYADWLAERGRDEEAARQRKLIARIEEDRERLDGIDDESYACPGCG
jgi:uncharacterized protein (TIGR02996 family)